MAAKIGILGGTFNPVHNGHLAIALNVLEKLSLDCVHLVPSSNPPHKNSSLLPYHIRKKMIELAIRDCPSLRISDLDYTPQQKSFTKNLIKRFQKVHPNDELFFIIGADNIPQLSTWYDYRWLLVNVQIVAVNRPGKDIKKYYDLDYFNKLIVLETEPVDVSSAEIREKLARGESIKSLVPSEVEEFIIQNSLYR